MLFISNINAQDKLAIYKSKAKAYSYTPYLDSAKFYFKKALPLALKRKDSVSVFRIHKYMGDAYEHHQKLDSTLLMYDFSEKYIPKNNLKLKAFLLNDKISMLKRCLKLKVAILMLKLNIQTFCGLNQRIFILK